MKKRMRFLAMLAGAVMLCGTIPTAPVYALSWWGSAAGEEFQNMTPLDDKGMFAGIPYGEGIGTADNYQVYTYHYAFDREDPWTDLDTGETKTELHHYEGNPVYVVCPRENLMQFTLRDGLDKADAENQMLEILQSYYPDIQDKVHNPGNYRIRSDEPMNEATFADSGYVDNSYLVVDLSEAAGSSEISDGIMRDLAKAGLISKFCTWGQTANYQQVTLESGNASPTVYYPTGDKWNADYTKLEPIYYDWDAIAAWVAEHHPECEFVRVTLEDTELAKKIGYYDYEQNRAYFGNNDEMYAVIPPDGTAFPAHFAIAAELYGQFGIAAEWSCPESVSTPMIGQNALAVAGDLNIDCEINIADAVMLARLAAEDDSLQITDTGMDNADVNQDGLITILDTAVLLRELA